MLRPRNYQREDDRSVQSSVGSVIVMMTAVLFLEMVFESDIDSKTLFVSVNNKYF